MLALATIRQRPDVVRTAMTNRGDDPSLIDRILEIDQANRTIVQELEGLRAQQNQASKYLASQKEKPPAILEELRALRDRVRELDIRAESCKAELDVLVLQVPNLPDPEVPIGPGEEANVVIGEWGQPREFDFEPKPHWELGESLGIIDFERGAKLTGSRFYHLRGEGARLQRALITWLLDVHTREYGYLEIYPPYLVRESVMLGSGQLPKFRDNLYRDAEEDLWLIPTAEVVLVNLHSDEILPNGALPLSYTAFTACFRREKMSAGRDVRGIKRGHQFDKVELVRVVAPEESEQALLDMVGHVEHLLDKLGLPRRRLALCTGDLGFGMQRTFDLEIWSPGVGEWLEVSSCSNAGDFQARRANIRFRRSAGARPELVHTLNGSGLGIPRTLLAIMETYQEADGSISVPEVLRPYMGGTVRISRD
ncbi:MAG: serine--tRNA ligase [Chloroflexota bacterium]